MSLSRPPRAARRPCAQIRAGIAGGSHAPPPSRAHDRRHEEASCHVRMARAREATAFASPVRCAAAGALSGFRVCQPPSGCRPTGEVCRADSDCCGWSGAPDPVMGPVTCSKASPTAEFGRCDNGGSCREPGSICKPGDGDSCSAENNCCEHSTLPSNYCNNNPENCCKKDSLGIPRCLIKPVDCGDQRKRRVQARQRSCRDRVLTRHPTRKVAQEDHASEGRRVHVGRRRAGAHASSTQQDRRRHSEDGAHDGFGRPARVSAP